MSLPPKSAACFGGAPCPAAPPDAPTPFPVLWPAEYRCHALSLGARSPLLPLGDFHPSEDVPDPDAFDDPVGEAGVQPVPFVVRKHRDRAVVLTTARCFFYCRFCFRRGALQEPGRADWERLFAWLGAEPELEEVVLSGGDPLTLDDGQLRAVAGKLERVAHLRRWRVHTRAPLVAPDRVTPGLVAALQTRLPLRVVVHAAHPAELRPAVFDACRRLQDAGFPVLDQTVLLAGVNDAPEPLADLFGRLAGMGVAPYYLHHPDRAPGNGTFRVSLRRGLAVYRGLLERSPPVSLGGHTPPYVVDVPDGGGKAPVASLVPVGEQRRGNLVRVRYRREGAPEGPRSFEWWDVWEPRDGKVRCRNR